MRMGLEHQGWTVTFANDIDERKDAMYASHFRDSTNHFVRDDIHKLPVDMVPHVTLATASFPCTDLSLAGSRDGINGKESSAFWGFTRILEQLGERKPPFVLIENVPGFLTSHQGRDFLLAMQALNGLGYSVDAFVIDAVRFVPQSRQRLFVVGTLDQLYPEPVDPLTSSANSMASDLRPKALTAYIAKYRESIRWQIRPLPFQQPTKLRLEDVLEHLSDDHSAWWNQARATKLLNQMSLKHRMVADAMIAGSSWSYGTVFRRMREDKIAHVKRSMAELRTDGIAGCLRTPKGGSAKQILFNAGFGKYFVRLITPREAARLMGADDYVLPESLDQAYFGFGDAVCVPVVEWVAQYYLSPLVEALLESHS